MLEQKKTRYGVIVGRFQVHELHEGHRNLIDSVLSRHKRVLILIGSTPDLMCTRNNPLDYYTRMLMIDSYYPYVALSPIKDHPDDDKWSYSLDEKIMETFGNVSDSKDVTLYGSRDGFIPHYSGRFPTIELDATIEISGNQVRKIVSEEVRRSTDFRRGAIYAAYNKYPVAYMCADVACIKGGDVAMVRKKTDLEGHWRFPGGFLSPYDDGIEDLARRELAEETGLSAEDWKYVNSFKIDDWRYRKEKDNLFTTFFKCTYQFGKLEAKDDVFESIWMGMIKRNIDFVMPEHKQLFKSLTSKRSKK